MIEKTKADEATNAVHDCQRHQTVHLRIKPPLVHRLDAACQLMSRTRTGILKEALFEWLEYHQVHLDDGNNT